MSLKPMPDGAEPRQRPSTVDYAVYALIVRCVLAVAAALASYGARPELTKSLSDANKSKNWSPAELHHNVDLYLRGTLITVVVMGVLVLVITKFIRDGRNWARWLYLIFAVVLAGDIQRVLGFFEFNALLLRTLTGLTGVAAVAAVVLLFLPPSNAYFRPVGGAGGVLGALFAQRAAARRPVAGPPATAEPAGPADAAGPTEGAGAAEPIRSAEAAESGDALATRRPPRAKSRRTGAE